MPFRSLAQERFLFAKHPEVAVKFMQDSTGKAQHLPEKVEPKVETESAAVKKFSKQKGMSPWMHMSAGAK